MNEQKNIMILYTGGTIGSVHDEKTGSLKPVDFRNLQQLVPELGRLEVNLSFSSLQTPVDSSDMSPSGWLEMLEIIEGAYDTHDGFVILHGTDTMPYSASALSFMIQGLGKPVIFTGSQLPLNVIRSDGRENILTAVEIAAFHENGLPKVQEVCIFFQSKLYRGNRTVKISAEHFNAFDSPNLPPLAQAGVHIEWWKGLRRSKARLRPPRFIKTLEPGVAVITLFPGIQAGIVRAVCNAPGIRGIILRSFGSGNAPLRDGIVEVLARATEKGILIVNVTQCLTGRVEQAKYYTGKALEDIGVEGGSDITAEAAVCKLMYLLGRYPDIQLVKREFRKNLRGEMRKNDDQ